MQPSQTAWNGSLHHWLVVRSEPPGQFTAQVVGLPELHAVGRTREEALQQVRALLNEWLTTGQLVAIETPRMNPLLQFQGHLDPADPLEQAYVDELARQHQADLERALQEYDSQCSDASSTPTT